MGPDIPGQVSGSSPKAQVGLESKKGWRQSLWFKVLVAVGLISLVLTSSPVLRRLNDDAQSVETALTSGALQPNTTAGPRYFVLVQGCIPPTPCERNSVESWGEYGALIEELFNENNWGKGANNGQDQTFAEWSETHIRYVGASWLGNGEDALREAVTSIANADSQANIHILGHSIAGGAIARYLHDLAKKGGPGQGQIKSAVMVDSPLLVTVLIVPMVGLDVWKLGESADKLGVIAVSIDTPNDFVGAFSIKDVYEEGNPTYPEASGLEIPKRQKYYGIGLPPSKEELAWHDHTSRYLATQLRDFLRTEWR
jgi:hypothetical protein